VIGPRPLYVTAALLAATGLLLRLAPAGSATAGSAVPPLALPPAVASAAVAAPPGDAEESSAIISSNVFSPRRAPPATRLVPDWARPETTAATSQRSKPAEPRMHLYGITKGPGGAVALIDADPRIPGAEVYRVGDEVRGGRIAAVTDSTVVIARPSGPLTLRLPVTDAER
jgi:hypothetical protein